MPLKVSRLIFSINEDQVGRYQLEDQIRETLFQFSFGKLKQIFVEGISLNSFSESLNLVSNPRTENLLVMRVSSSRDKCQPGVL